MSFPSKQSYLKPYKRAYAPFVSYICPSMFFSFVLKVCKLQLWQTAITVFRRSPSSNADRQQSLYSDGLQAPTLTDSSHSIQTVSKSQRWQTAVTAFRRSPSPNADRQQSHNSDGLQAPTLIDSSHSIQTVSQPQRWQTAVTLFRRSPSPNADRQRSNYSDGLQAPTLADSSHSIQTVSQFQRWQTAVTLFRRSPSSNANRHQSHHSDGSNLNSGCNYFALLQNQNLNYTWSEQQFLRNCLSAKFTLYTKCRINMMCGWPCIVIQCGWEKLTRCHGLYYLFLF